MDEYTALKADRRVQYDFSSCVRVQIYFVLYSKMYNILFIIYHSFIWKKIIIIRDWNRKPDQHRLVHMYLTVQYENNTLFGSDTWIYRAVGQMQIVDWLDLLDI